MEKGLKKGIVIGICIILAVASVFLFARKYIVGGVARGGLKG